MATGIGDPRSVGATRSIAAARAARRAVAEERVRIEPTACTRREGALHVQRAGGCGRRFAALLRSRVARDAEPRLAPRAQRIALYVLAWFNLVSALVGMVGLTAFGGMGIPLEWLAGSAFHSYLWPGIILGVVVGGVQALALIAQYGRYRLVWGLHAAAGLVMMSWIFIEIAIMLVWSPLHGIYFATGLLQTAVAVLALGAWPRPFLQRDPRGAPGFDLQRERSSIAARDQSGAS